MNSAVFFFVALAAFAVDAAVVVPLNGVWGNNLYSNGLSTNGLFGTSAIRLFSGSNFAPGSFNTIKLVPASSLLSTTSTSTPSTQVVSNAPMNFPSVIHPAPGVRCVCTSTNAQPAMNVQNLGSFSFTY